MLSFSGSFKIFVLVEPCDMRKGFNGLYGMVSTTFGEDPRSGALFVFSNRRHTRIKILYWDGSGLWVLTKRLERGSFSWPPVIAGESACVRGARRALTEEANTSDRVQREDHQYSGREGLAEGISAGYGSRANMPQVPQVHQSCVRTLES
jgi:transposase